MTLIGQFTIAFLLSFLGGFLLMAGAWISGVLVILVAIVCAVNFIKMIL